MNNRFQNYYNLSKRNKVDLYKLASNQFLAFNIFLKNLNLFVNLNLDNKFILFELLRSFFIKIKQNKFIIGRKILIQFINSSLNK